MRAPPIIAGTGFSRAAGCAAIGVGLTVIVGWAAGIDWLTRLAPGWPSMKFSTATCFVLLGSALVLLAPSEAAAGRRRAGAVSAATAAAIGLIVLVEYAVGWNLVIDRIPLADTSGSHYPGRMSVPTAASFVLLGIAMVLLDAPSPGHRVAEVLALVAGVTSLTILAAYLYDVPFASELNGLATVALHTAATLLLLSLGVLTARRHAWLSSLLSSRGPGGLVARRLIPVGIAVPVLVGLVTVTGVRRGYFGFPFGVSLFVGASIGLHLAAVLSRAHQLEWADRASVLAERALSESRGLSQAVLDSSLDAVVTMDHQGTIVDANAAAEGTFGYRPDELIGRPLADAIIPESLRQQHRDGLARYLVTGEERVLGRRLRVVALRANGDEFPAEVSILRVDGPGPPLFTGFIRDITDRVDSETELARAHDELVAHAAELEGRVEERTRHLAEVNAELESFAHTVSHDLRAPLRAVDGFSRILIERHDEEISARVHGYLVRIREGAQRMGRLIDELLEFSRLGRNPLRKRPVEPAAIALQALAEVRSGAESDGPAEVVIGDLPPCDADPVLLHQVFLNLLDNSLKFTRGRMDARVEVGSRRDGNGRIVYFVQDNGIGFDMAYAGKVFGVFQRLNRRELFEGTGVGLATVQRIVHRHGGRIWAESAPEQGATFSFTVEGEVDDPEG